MGVWSMVVMLWQRFEYYYYYKLKVSMFSVLCSCIFILNKYLLIICHSNCWFLLVRFFQVFVRHADHTSTAHDGFVNEGRYLVPLLLAPLNEAPYLFSIESPSCVATLVLPTVHIRYGNLERVGWKNGGIEGLKDGRWTERRLKAVKN